MDISALRVRDRHLYYKRVAENGMFKELKPERKLRRLLPRGKGDGDVLDDATFPEIRMLPAIFEDWCTESYILWDVQNRNTGLTERLDGDGYIARTNLFTVEDYCGEGEIRKGIDGGMAGSRLKTHHAQKLPSDGTRVSTGARHTRFRM